MAVGFGIFYFFSHILKTFLTDYFFSYYTNLDSVSRYTNENNNANTFLGIFSVCMIMVSLIVYRNGNAKLKRVDFEGHLRQ